MKFLRTATLGLLLGFAWGVLARVWMHFLTDDPQFTWSGTISILVLTSLTGACVGAISGARRAGRSGWWRLLAVPTLVLFASPGMLLLPAYVLGGLSLSGRWPAWLRGGLGLVLLGWTGFVLIAIVLGDGTPGTVIPVAGWLLTTATMALAGREIFLPWRVSRLVVSLRPAPIPV